jgi:hypothetical protein
MLKSNEALPSRLPGRMSLGKARMSMEERMATTIEARFDGQVFRALGVLALPPNTTVRLTIEPLPEKPTSFLRTARSPNLQGPPDWASNLDGYLYGEETGGAG